MEVNHFAEIEAEDVPEAARPEDGDLHLQLEPLMEVREKEDLSLRQFYRGCYLLDAACEEEIDPDKILSDGDPIHLPEVTPLPVSRDFFRLMVINHGDYNDIAEWPHYHVQAVLGVLVNHFIRASRGSSTVQKAI